MEGSFLNDVMTQVYPLAVSAVVIIIASLVQVLKAWVKGKTKNESVLLAMDNFQNIVDAVVDQIADDIRKETGPTDDTPGVITHEEAMQIKEHALGVLRDKVPPDLKATLESLTGDLETWISGLVVNSVRMRNIQYK